MDRSSTAAATSSNDSGSGAARRTRCRLSLRTSASLLVSASATASTVSSGTLPGSLLLVLSSWRMRSKMQSSATSTQPSGVSATLPLRKASRGRLESLK